MRGTMERGANRESATALLVTAVEGASGDGGGGGSPDMAVIFAFSSVARENKEESKNLNVP